jgi:catechol 2,3-dioxygenase-like lactoylglutathione lyase family enzyme
MDIRRAVPIVAADDLELARSFYGDFLGFEVGMEEQGFRIFRSPSNPTAQVITAARTGETMDPRVLAVKMSVEVPDVDAAYEDAQRRELRIVYPITNEPWGVRRFFVEDPDGNVINVVSHKPHD